jgi:hypothetical protein
MRSIDPSTAPGKPIPQSVAIELRNALCAIQALGNAMARCNLSSADVADAVAVQRQAALPLEISTANNTMAPTSEPTVHCFTKAELLAKIDAIEAVTPHPPRLGERSRAFLAGLRQLCDQYDPVRLTTKQLNWLRGLTEDARVEVEQ